ncbi:tyrosine-type recombinase/integrase [Planctomycetota bacterium]
MEDFIQTIGDIDFQKVRVSHGERYRQACLDRGNSPETVAKKLRQVKRFFQLAVMRDQLDKNPLAHVKVPRGPKKKVRVYSLQECERLLKAAQGRQDTTGLNWELFMSIGLVTGMRRGEILNTTWRDVNFENLTIEVNPKKSTEETWEWLIKDSEHRILPLTEDLITMLAMHQHQQSEGYPYVFIPPRRYEWIQKIRKQGKWVYSNSRLKLINNFRKNFLAIQKIAGIEGKTFHDLRRTALSNWLASGMSEYDVMTLAGHSNFSTTHSFYLAVNQDLIDRARQVAADGVCKNLAQIWHKCPSERDIKKGQQTQVLDGQEHTNHAREDSNLRPTD